MTDKRLSGGELEAECRRRFSYDPETGVFTRLIRYSPNAAPGSIVRSQCGGYLWVGVANKMYGLHRLAFAMMGHPIPKLVDHINGIRDDNRWANLRGATGTQNVANRLETRSRKSGFAGVTVPRGNHRKFQASIRLNRKLRHLGSFDTAEEAHAAYLTARKEMFGEYDGFSR